MLEVVIKLMVAYNKRYLNENTCQMDRHFAMKSDESAKTIQIKQLNLKLNVKTSGWQMPSPDDPNDTPARDLHYITIKCMFKIEWVD